MIDEILPAISGEILADDANLTGASHDWGNLVHARPRLVVRPASATDVATVVRFASKRGIPVAARGAGHSPYGQGQADGGIVLDMTSLPPRRVVMDGSVSVDAGARWRDVLEVALPHGLTPPVFTDYLDVTVGGTLVVGGVGGAAHHYGVQTDTVVELEVVTGAGEVLTCSRDSNRKLFDAMLAGLGQCGVITRATLQLIPAPTRARRWKLYYDSLSAFLSDQREVVRDGRFEYLEGQPLLGEGGWRYMLEAVGYYTPPASPDEEVLLGALSFVEVESEDTTYFDFLNRVADGEAALRTEGSWFHPHPWIDVFLPDSVVEQVVAETLTTTDQSELGTTGLLLLYPLRADRLKTPLFKVPDGELVWLFSLLRTGSPIDPLVNARMVELNVDLYRKLRALGGKVYPSTAMPRTTEDWREHFGPEWPILTEAKALYAPESNLNPGQRLDLSESP
ncbi:dehydrogenase [Amycolatopsis sp. WAC 01375]|uniref:FAD-binding protein n=1 Tax=Amycolatopsis sp. WAC 01375 TaxID=2203194 RepID=UPI000F79B89E|nr:FAD-binding protein [Amycolatopsis sp. WAC 01375]RSM80570.1 dehydrogenase [Amycolatopsis sp. WAC 01375]